jgi:TRAP-type C4-dicarboxylate transport system substrate-binding protein
MKHSLAWLSATALLCVAAPVRADTVLTTSSWVPPTHALTLAQKEWCDLVTKNSKGKIRCNQLPRAVAGPPGTFDAIKNGLADVSFTVHGYTPGRFVLTQMAEFPFLGDAAEPLSVAFNKVAMQHPEFLKEHEGVHVLAFFTHGPGIVFNTKHPVTKLADLQDLKWRVGGGMVNEISKALGMNVTLKPAPESYELLSGGVMDGTLFPSESIESFKIDKLIKYATTFPGGLYNTSFVFMMNPAKYNSLSPEEKKVIDAASGEVAARIIGRHWDKVDRRAYGLMQANNVQVTKADAKFVAEVKARTAPLEARWEKEAAAKGLKNPAKVLADLRAEIAKQTK